MANENIGPRYKKESLRLLDQTLLVNGHKISIADLPDQSVIINNHKISIAGLSERSSIISALAIREEQNFSAADEILDNIGICNPYILFILLSLATCWCLSIMNIMCAVFYESGLSCNLNDKECLEERWKMFTIEDQFHIHENSWLSIEWTTSIFFVGDLFGGILLSILSDVIGRRNVAFPSILLLNLFGILSTYAQTYYAFLFVRFFEGFFFTSSAIIVWVFASECVSIRNHSRLLVLFGFFWVFGYSVVLVIAKFFPDWRSATLIVCVPTAVLAVFLWVTLPDSFIYLTENLQAKSLRLWLRRVDKNLFEVALFTRVLNDSRPVQRNFRQFANFLSDNSIYIRYMILSALISNRNIFIPIWLLAKFGASSTFNFMLVYNSEIFPTIIRNTALGLCAVCSNFGAAVGPHVFHTASFHYSTPFLIFGAVSIASAFFALGLPETKSSNKSKPFVVVTSTES